MRTEILSYLNTISNVTLGTYSVSSRLPWLDNGAPLYHHNRKHIYVDTDQSRQTPVSDALNQAGFVDETTTVTVYFVNDAKQLPDNYDAVVTAIKGARLITATQGYTERTVNVSSDYLADDLITTIEFSFRKLITN
jgi:hypothetical protein